MLKPQVFYKDQQNAVFVLDNDSGEESLKKARPELTFTRITKEEAAVLLSSSQQPALTPELVRAIRNDAIASVQWRYERNAREIRLGLPETDDLAILDKYIQDLADLTEQKGFPEKVIWPADPFAKEKK